MSRRGALKMATGELHETLEYAASRKDLQKLYVAELFVLLGTVTVLTYAMNAGMISIAEGMVVLAAVSLGELLLDALATG